MIENSTLERAKDVLKRPLFVKVLSWLDRHEVILILGSRQVGKTSCLLWLGQHLSKRIPRQNLFYLDLEDPILASRIDEGLHTGFVQFLKDEGADFSQTVYVLLDEIQHLKTPGKFLKLIHDHHPQVKLVVTGSSTLDIRKKFNQTLAGRQVVFTLRPLSFDEYLFFTGKNNLFRIYQEELGMAKIIKGRKLPEEDRFLFLKDEFENFWEDFVVYGGYPEVAQIPNRGQKIEKLSEIYATYVRRDIRDLAEIGDVPAFNRLVELAATQIGQLINFGSLASEARLDRRTLERYLFLLENTFIIKLVRPYFSNRRKELTKMPKLFFEDAGLRNAVLKDFTSLSKRQEAGALIENMIFSQLEKTYPLSDLYFWRSIISKNEVDFILKKKEVMPVEVKYQRFSQTRVPSGLMSFIRQYTPKQAVVVTRDFWGGTKANRTQILFLPAWAV